MITSRKNLAKIWFMTFIVMYMYMESYLDDIHCDVYVHGIIPCDPYFYFGFWCKSPNMEWAILCPPSKILYFHPLPFASNAFPNPSANWECFSHMSCVKVWIIVILLIFISENVWFYSPSPPKKTLYYA